MKLLIVFFPIFTDDVQAMTACSQRQIKWHLELKPMVKLNCTNKSWGLLFKDLWHLCFCGLYINTGGSDSKSKEG